MSKANKGRTFMLTKLSKDPMYDSCHGEPYLVPLPRWDNGFNPASLPQRYESPRPYLCSSKVGRRLI